MIIKSAHYKNNVRTTLHIKQQDQNPQNLVNFYWVVNVTCMNHAITHLTLVNCCNPRLAVYSGKMPV